MQEASCVSFMIGSLSFGEMSVLKPKATVKAGAVPLIHLQFRRGRIEPKALRLPDTRRPCLCAMPGHTQQSLLVGFFLKEFDNSSPFPISFLAASFFFWSFLPLI